MRTTTSENLQNNREAHDLQPKMHTDFGRRLQRRAWDQDTEMNVQVLVNTHTHTQQRQQERKLDETLADVTKFHSTQHDAQEDSWETNDLQISKRKWDANRPHQNPEKTLEIQQRCRSQRYDPHGKLPQMCHGDIRDHNSKERWHPLKKDKLEIAKHDRRDQTDKKLGKASLSLKKGTKRSLQISKKKLKPQTRNWVKAKKTDETKKKKQHKQKV